MLVKIFVLKVGKELIFIAYFEELAHLALVVVEDAVELGNVLVAILTEPVFDVCLILVLANDILELRLFKQSKSSKSRMQIGLVLRSAVENW